MAALQPYQRIIVALDFPTLPEAEAMASLLAGSVGVVKVGLELVAGAGPQAVRRMRELGHQVFWDTKLHDIPNTVAGAAAQVGRAGAAMYTVHALGGREMVAAAREAVAGCAPRPRVLAITLLTSMSEDTLAQVGIRGPVEERVVSLALLAQEAGADGVVASPHEVAAIRAACGPSLLIVTPGIRPAGAQAGDQQRPGTPAQAVAAGADYLVIGRPITRAADPAQAVAAIVQEIEGR